MNELLVPHEGEYESYYTGYVNWVIGKDVPTLLLEQVDEIRKFYEQMGEEKSLLAYETGKWTGKEVLGHIIDTDRIMTFRALCFARGEKAALPGFDQDQYVATADFNNIPLSALLEDFELSRKALVSLLKNLPESTYANIGVANGFQVSVRALFHIIAGHAQHHLNVLMLKYK
ncbi:DinB family protein [Aquiflexum sp. LQ15W]|uniref:DinB family protein n=1 Tax=Cognataquiflexum nitidum TaxID=2922272 RepID=UPI001F12F1C4|nr:DinB family protein [Cognataquiflexum nitidum]MCH6202172.1 DinB family protein [Cognataquiflexum nitidum]